MKLGLAVAAAVAIGVFAHSDTPILTYHDFIDSRDANSLWFDCTTHEFEQQVEWLQRHGAHFVTLDQIFEHLTKHVPLPSHAIALTAADGYEGFYLRALPILRKHRIPLTMFVHTKYVGGTQGRPKMTWKQLEELQRGGLVSIQSQTVTHPADLRTLSGPRLTWEMTASKKALESHLGVTIRYLAYPNGKFDPRCERAANAARYLMAFSEVTHPCESSPNRWAVNRYVHTKWRQAWADCYGRRG
jgi:peptidoglycan/xylan/chitin deacetylase (PgdA/CDA1 family)